MHMLQLREMFKLNTCSNLEKQSKIMYRPSHAQLPQVKGCQIYKMDKSTNYKLVKVICKKEHPPSSLANM